MLELWTLIILPTGQCTRKDKMKLLISTRSDERVKQMSDISHPIFKKYAKNAGADFMVLDHEPVSDSGDGRPHYRIMKHYELHEKYDRILHLDTDMVLSPKCPNLFEIVPPDHIGSIFEDKGSRRQARLGCIRNAQRQFGFIDWFSGYINTGVFISSKSHREIYQKIDNTYWTGFGSDDVHLGYLIRKNNFKLMELPFQFNHMTMFSESWNGSPDRFQSHIIHYAGAGIFDGGVETKVKQMMLDYKRWYK